MAENKNGMMGRVVMYLVGVLVTLICFIAIPTLANHTIQNDKESRARDDKIGDEIHAVEKDVGDKFDKIMEGLSDIKVSQQATEIEIKWIKGELKK